MHQLHNIFQESSHTKLFREPQHLSSGQNNPTKGTRTTFKTPSPGKESRLLLRTKTVHPWPVGVLYVDRNVLPNDPQFHIYPRVDFRTCSRYQWEWYWVARTHAQETKMQLSQNTRLPTSTSSTCLLHEMQLRTARPRKWDPHLRCSSGCPSHPSSAAPRTTATAAELKTPPTRNLSEPVLLLWSWSWLLNGYIILKE